MWRNNMVTDGFGKLENNSCMFKQLIVPITHTIWAISYFFPVFDIKKSAEFSQPLHNIGYPKISMHSRGRFGCGDMLSYTKGSQYTNRRGSSVCLRKAISLTAVHTHGALVNRNSTGCYFHRFLNNGTSP